MPQDEPIVGSVGRFEIGCCGCLQAGSRSVVYDVISRRLPLNSWPLTPFPQNSYKRSKKQIQRHVKAEITTTNSVSCGGGNNPQTTPQTLCVFRKCNVFGLLHQKGETTLSVIYTSARSLCVLNRLEL